MIRFLLPKNILPRGKIIYVSEAKIKHYSVLNLFVIFFGIAVFGLAGAGIYFFTLRINSSSYITQTELEIKRLRQVNETLKNHLNLISEDIDAFNAYLEINKVSKASLKKQRLVMQSTEGGYMDSLQGGKPNQTTEANLGQVLTPGQLQQGAAEGQVWGRDQINNIQNNNLNNDVNARQNGPANNSPTGGLGGGNQGSQSSNVANLVALSNQNEEDITKSIALITDKITAAHKNLRLAIEAKIRAAKGLNLEDSFSLKNINDEFTNAGYLYKVSYNQAANQILPPSGELDTLYNGGEMQSGSQIELLSETQRIYLDNLNLKYKINILKKLDSLIANAPSDRPMDFYTRISSYFGGRIDPKGHYHAFHHGIDIVGEKNEKIKAVADGMVINASWLGGYGNYIEINHGHGIKTGYGHLSKILVSRGDKVKKGDIIAVQGSTGKSTGDHLHYEVKVGGVRKDPMLFMRQAQFAGLPL